MPNQLTHYNTKNTSKLFPIILVCDGVNSPSNIGSLFRLCDALGVSEIVFYNSDLNINSSRLQKTARSTQKKVSYSESVDIIETLSNYKSEGYKIASLEITDTSVSVNKFSAVKDQKLVLIIGNEQQGVSNKVLQISDTIIKIDMFGKNSSMNVVQATSIALYTLINKLYIY
jgi:tRNA G18 (ribose-2'-O)-methylase SpoU